MLGALPLADQARTGDRLETGSGTPPARAAIGEGLAEILEPAQRRGREAAMGQFLDAIGLAAPRCSDG